jgi:transcriptional regulator with XRE-family HTH domain
MDITDAITIRPESGDALAWARRLAGLTQAQVAAQMRVTRPRVSAIEAMARPNRQTIRRYLAAIEAAARTEAGQSELETDAALDA